MQMEQQFSDTSARVEQLHREVAKVIVGQQEHIKYITIALLCNGHILLEGVPGVAKTTMIKTMAQALDLHFKRIQFTPDLLPADLVGTLIYNPKTQEFETKKGPIFANLVLADEINRAPAKVQAALLESMQEGQVTIGSTTFKLDMPFLVFATQNPIEQEGTYRLPEAQVDRFMFKITISYPTQEEEREIVRRADRTVHVQPLLNQKDILHAQQLVKQIHVHDRIVEYITQLVFATRTPEKYGLESIKSLIQYGVSPRATLTLYHASQAHALLAGRTFVTPDDVKAVIYPALRHRMVLSYEAEAQQITSDALIRQILAAIATP